MERNNIVFLIGVIIIFTWLLVLRNRLNEKVKIILVVLTALSAIYSFYSVLDSGIKLFIYIVTGMTCFAGFFLVHSYSHNMYKVKLKDISLEVWLDFIFLINIVWTLFMFVK